MRLSGDRKERERYEKRRELRLNEISTLSYAEEKGAKKEKIEIAKNLIQKGLDDDFIAETTGVSVEEVREIRKEQN